MIINTNVLVNSALNLLLKLLNLEKISKFFKTLLRIIRVVVVLDTRIYVYNFADLRLIDAIDTCLNTKGICALSPDPSISVLATPDK